MFPRLPYKWEPLYYILVDNNENPATHNIPHYITDFVCECEQAPSYVRCF